MAPKDQVNQIETRGGNTSIWKDSITNRCSRSVVRISEEIEEEIRSCKRT